MTNKGPVDMESMEGGIPSGLEGRKVDPDKPEEATSPNKEVVPMDEHMKAILEHIPEELRERVSKLQREELSMPGIPRDRDAYEAYLGAEKIMRDALRRKAKKDLNYDNLPKQTG